ncbi:MAG: glycosyltransferase family 2 protein, partial [Bacteroidaceae bacterium]|nr:glycosyltransferase family 2 protein [Bacteroidaceae bacterium]
PLLRAAGKLEKAHCTRVVSGLWEITNKALKKNLLGERPSLMILNIYKLGFFCYLLAKSQK